MGARTGGGGTSVPDKTAVWPWLVPLAVLPLTGFIVHKLSAGTSCSWDYGAMGGACRVVILLSGLAAIATAVLALFAARAIAGDTGRGTLFSIIAIVVVVLAVLAGKQFGDYNRDGRDEMDDTMCRWVREDLPACIDTVWGPGDGDLVRKSQPNCLAHDSEITNYALCMKLTDCKQIIDCVAGKR